MIELYSPEGGLNLIIKTAGNLCNINCKYCFEVAKDVRNSNLTPGLLEKTIESIEKKFSIVFHGGEPLIVGKKRFSELLDIVRKYYPNKVISVKIQTNGTLLNQGWIDMLFSEYKDLGIEIAISLDGTESMNALRVDSQGKPTFSKVRKAYQLLENNGISAGMLSVISKHSLRYSKEYIDMIESIPNLRFVKINALFNVENNELTEDSISPLEFSDFIKKSSSFYIEKGLYNRLPIEPLLSILQKINGKKSRYCNFSCNKCLNFVSIYPNGDIAPCDCFSVNEFLIGNINKLAKASLLLEDTIEAFLNSEEMNRLNRITDECLKCPIFSFCRGGCLSHRYYFRNNEKLRKEFCTSKKQLYDYFKSWKIKDKKEIK